MGMAAASSQLTPSRAATVAIAACFIQSMGERLEQRGESRLLLGPGDAHLPDAVGRTVQPRDLSATSVAS